MNRLAGTVSLQQTRTKTSPDCQIISVNLHTFALTKKQNFMAVNFLKRYIWLIDLINRRGYISFREISEAWSRSPLNDSGSALSERTFFNHKTAIEEMLGIEIKNDRTMGYYRDCREMLIFS